MMSGVHLFTALLGRLHAVLNNFTIQVNLTY